MSVNCGLLKTYNKHMSAVSTLILGLLMVRLDALIGLVFLEDLEKET